jgi:hypothetical protein
MTSVSHYRFAERTIHPTRADKAMREEAAE